MFKDFFSFKISREFVVLLFFMVATFFFFIYETEQMGVRQIYSEAAELQDKIKLARAENERLTFEIEDLKSDIGVVRLARERLRLVFPGEIIVKAVSSEEVRIQKIRNLNALKKGETKPIKREEITAQASYDDDETAADDSDSSTGPDNTGDSNDAPETDDIIIDDEPEAFLMINLKNIVEC